MDRRRILLVAAVLVAALGVVLVFLYVQGADRRAEDQFETTEVLVATARIEPGESIAEASADAKIAREPIARGQLLEGTFTSTEGITDQVATVAILPGEQIVAAKLGTSAAAATPLQIEEGDQAMSVNLTDPNRVAGFVSPGSRVAVYVTYDRDDPGANWTRLVVPEVTVLGIGSTAPAASAQTGATTDTGSASGTAEEEPLPQTILTLSVDQEELQQILWAQSIGELTLGLRTEDSRVRADGGTGGQNAFRTPAGPPSRGR